MQFPNAHAGVKKLFISEIISIVAAILTLVGVIVIAATSTNEAALAAAAIITSVGGIIFVVSFIFRLIGLLQGAKDEPNFRTGFWISIFGLVISIVSAILGFTQVPATVCTVLNALSDVASVVCTIFILSGVANLAIVLKDEPMAEKGKALINGVTILFILSVFLSIFPTFFANPNEGVAVMLSVFSIVAVVIEIVVYVNVLIYLAKAIKMLEK